MHAYNKCLTYTVIFEEEECLYKCEEESERREDEEEETDTLHRTSVVHKLDEAKPVQHHASHSKGCRYIQTTLVNTPTNG